MHGAEDNTSVMVEETFINIDGKYGVDGEDGHKKHIDSGGHPLPELLAVIIAYVR